METESELVARLDTDRRHSRRVIFWLIVVVIAIPVLGVLAAYCYDCNLPDDRDMLPVWTEVPIKENGLGRFQEWLESHPVPEITVTPGLNLKGSDWNLDQARKLVNGYSAALTELDALYRTDISKWRWKEGEKMAHMGASVSYLISIQTLSTITRHRAKILLVDRKPDEAADLGFELMRIGRGMQCQGNLIDILVAATIQVMGQSILADVAKQSPGYLPRPEVWREALIADEPPGDVLQVALKVEYESFRNVMADIRSGKIGSSALGAMSSSPESWVMAVGVRPNRSIRRYLELQRPVVIASTHGWKAIRDASERQMSDLKEIRGSTWRMVQLFLRGNPGGEILLSISLPTFAKILERFFSLRSLHSITFCQFAIREYELAHGELPKSLNDLVPAQLPSVPVDPFDDKPLRWNRETGTIYSVGPDAIDDGGLLDEARPYHGKDVGQRYWWSKAAPKK